MVQNNRLYTLANDVSHALDWFLGTTTNTSPFFDEWTKNYETGLTWDEIKSNKFENLVREAQGDELKLVMSHFGWKYCSSEDAKKAVELSKETDTEKREEGLESLEYCQ